MAKVLIYILSFVFMLGIIVLIHELGHFLVAKKFGVYCSEFSIGMGPVIFSKKYKETTYSLRLLPIGGFVAIAGEDEDDETTKDIPFERTLNGIKAHKQVLVMIAGVVMNFVLAWAAFFGVSVARGEVVVPKADYEITEVAKDSAAMKSGLQKGDVVEQVIYDNETFNIKDSDDLNRALGFNPGEKCIFKIQRGSKHLRVNIKPIYNKDMETYLVGIAPKMDIKKIGVVESMQIATQEVVDNTRLVFESLGRLLHGDNLKQLSGPVGIFEMTGKVAMGGLLPWLTLLAVLSINIGVFNLIPIPVLDGGRIVMVIIEKITGKKINEKVLNFVMYAGMLFLIGIMIFATFNDIGRIF